MCAPPQPTQTFNNINSEAPEVVKKVREKDVILTRGITFEVLVASSQN